MDSEGNKVDHEDRQNLKRLLEKPRDVKPLEDKQMKVNLGPGKVEKTSVKKMEEKFKLEEGGQWVLNDGTLINLRRKRRKRRKSGPRVVPE